MNSIKLSTKGQIILPKEIRKNMNLQPGAYFTVKADESKIILTVLKKTPIQRLYKKYKNASLTKSLEKSHAEEIKNENRS